MTLGASEIKKVRGYFKNPASKINSIKSTHAISQKAPTPLTGKILARRLKGLFSKKAADRLERNINESCEQLDD